MNLKNPLNWIKEIVLFIMIAIEAVLTFLSFKGNWSTEFTIALLFADVLTVFNGLMSFVNKFDNEHRELQKKIEKEHVEIKGAIELYNDIEELTYVSCFEGNYIESQQTDGTEIWIVSNCIDEPDTVLQQILKNLISGVKYYYVIPNDRTCEKDLQNAVERLSKLMKKNLSDDVVIKYIKDDLFDFLPTNIVDILYYCNPNSTDYNSNMKIFYSFQNSTKNGIFYKPVTLDNIKSRAIFNKMNDWKNREWTELHIK